MKKTRSIGNKKIKTLTLASLAFSSAFLLVNACANNSETLLVQPKPDADANQAFLNIKAELNQLTFGNDFSPIMAFKQPASAVKLSDFPVLKPQQNFGFLTQLIDRGFDEQKGEKYLDVQLTRGTETVDFPLTLSGFLKPTETAFEKQYNSEEYLNLLDQTRIIFLTTTQPRAQIKNFLDSTKLLTAINLEPNTNQPALLKKPLPEGMQIKISNVEAGTEFGLAAGLIRAQIQLVKDDLVSAIYFLQIDGFIESFVDFNEWINLFQTKFSPIKVPENQDYLQLKASEITNLEQLKQLLDPNFENLNGLMQVSLIDLVANSANDKIGSLKAVFEFKPFANLEIKARATITLFGFQIT